MQRLGQDVRIAVRVLRRAPAFAVAAVLTLSLGIGAATSVFSVAYGILLSPLPMRDPARLVALWAHNPTLQPEHFPLSGEEYRALARESRTFSQAAAYEYHNSFDRPMRFGDTVVTVPTAPVTGNFFDVVGVRPRLGRLLRPDDDLFGSPAVAVISEAFWRRAFGGDSSVIGKRVVFYTTETTLVGVVPAGLDFPVGAEVWMPSQKLYVAPSDTLRGYYNVVARLKPGMNAGQAASELGAFLQRADEPHSGARRALGNTLRPVAHPIGEAIVGEVRPAIRIVVGAVALLLLVTCINLANLMLVRAVERRREFAVRSALGASRARLTQQVLVESGALALAGGALGAAFASVAISLFLAAAPAGLPRLDRVGTNGPVLVVALVLTIGVAVAFGLLPAVMSGRLSLGDDLRERSGARGGGGTHRTRSALVAAQVAVAVAVIVAAGVVARSFERLMRIDLGFAPERLLVVKLAGASNDLSNVAAFDDALDNALARVRAIPGVRSATTLIAPPFQPEGLDIAYSLPGDDPKSTAGRPMVDGLVADAEYFSTLGIPLLKGRLFTAADRENAAKVVIVDASLARGVWPGQDPIGKRIGLDTAFYSVVGVVGETRYRDLLGARRSLYFPYRQVPFAPGYIAVRADGVPTSIAASLRAAVRGNDSRLFVSQITPLSDRVDATTAQPRLDTVLLGGFSISILLLTALGLYSIAATYVRHREFELAVRVALGAAPADVVRLVVRQGLGVVIGGAAVGVLVALLGAGILGSIVYGVRERDPLMFAAALGGVWLVALAAFLIPARRAARANPAGVLRAG